MSRSRCHTGRARARTAAGRYTPARRKILFVLPNIPDEGSEALKNGLAIRNQATRTGVCPGCGETADTTAEGFEAGAVHVVNFGHADGCPALLQGFL